MRSAAQRRAAVAIQQERQLRLSQLDFSAIQSTIVEPFASNLTLQAALKQVCTRVTRVFEEQRCCDARSPERAANDIIFAASHPMPRPVVPEMDGAP